VRGRDLADFFVQVLKADPALAADLDPEASFLIEAEGC